MEIAEILFWQQFRETNGFTKYVTKELISRNIFSVRENFWNFHSVVQQWRILLSHKIFRENNEKTQISSSKSELISRKFFKQMFAHLEAQLVLTFFRIFFFFLGCCSKPTWGWSRILWPWLWVYQVRIFTSCISHFQSTSTSISSRKAKGFQGKCLNEFYFTKISRNRKLLFFLYM